MDAVKILRAQWDRVLAVLLALIGLIALIAGWAGASQALYPAQQLPYVISGGLLGLFAVIAAGTLWLSADIRDEWRQLDIMREAVELRFGGQEASRAAAVSEPPVVQRT